MRHLMKYIFAQILLVFFGVFLFLPLFVVLKQGLDPDVTLELFRNHLYIEGLINACLICLATTFLVFLISLPMAVLYDKYEFPGKGLCPALMMIPMILPPFVGALGFQQILGHYGVLNSILTSLSLPPVDWLGGSGRFWSICVVEALHMYPILYLNLITSLANIDPSMEEAACNVGASRRTKFFRITLPLIRPGILAGGSLVLIWSFTELGTPLMFGYTRVTPVQIFNGITELGTNPAAFSLVLAMLVVSCVLYIGGRILLGRNPSAGLTKGAMGSRSRILCGWKKWIPTAVFGIFAFLSALPHIALILTAGSESWYRTILPLRYSWIHFRNALSDTLVVPSILNSLKYAGLAVVISVIIGLMTAFLAKRSNMRGAGVFDLMAMLPLMIPGIVIAIGFLGISIRYSWASLIFDPIGNPVWLIAAAYAVRRVPYVVRSVTSGLEQTPEELENAARNTGANAFLTFWKITIPLIAANLVVGVLFAFSFSMMEVSDSLILAQKTEFYPITKAIYELSQYLGTGPYAAAAFGVWAMQFLAATLVAASVLLGRKMGSLFRM